MTKRILYVSMKKYTAIFIDTALAAVVCSLFQAIIAVILFARNVGLDIFPAQLFLINFVLTFPTVFIPLLGFNAFKVKYRQK